MSSFRAASGLPVVAEDSAEQAGTIKGFVVDPARGTIRAISLGGNRSSTGFIAWSDVASFGTDAVIVRPSASIADAANGDERGDAHDQPDMLDRRVLTEVGDELGVIDDVAFDPLDGHLEFVTVNGEQLDPGRLIGIGTYAVVVTASDDA